VPVKTIDAVSRALRVLDAVSQRQPAGLGELARALDIDKSGVQRILHTLHTEGWIAPAADGSGWLLTGRALTVGGRFGARSGVRERGQQAMREAHAATGETTWLSVLDGRDLMVVAEQTSGHVLRVSFPVGHTGPLGFDSAAGTAVLAAFSDATAAERLGASLTTAQRKRLARVRDVGYAVQAAAELPLWAAAAPLRTRPGEPAAAVVLAAPRHRLARPDLVRLGELLANRVRAAEAD
jgi:IclR family transcriptional regulator, acetate operon repressor